MIYHFIPYLYCISASKLEIHLYNIQKKKKISIFLLIEINQYQNNAIFLTQINLISSCHFFDLITKKSSNDESPYFLINDNVSRYNVSR